MKEKRKFEYDLKSILISIVLIVLVWYLVLAIRPKIRNILPCPHQVAKAMFYLLFDSSFWTHFLGTLKRVIIGFFLALILAAPTGFFINRNRVVRALLVFPIDFLRSLPAIVLLPLILIFLDPGETMRITLIVIPAFLVMTLSFVYGLDRCSVLRKNVSRKVGLGERDIFVKIELREALPEIVTGMRISISIALILAIIAEMLFTAPGFGSFIDSCRMNVNRSPELWGAIVILGSLGFILNRIFIWIDNQYCFWKGK